ncbi:hypothetical protein GTY96_21265 [Corallococcus sp. c25j21]|nr:hypothetical protein [Corallococcus silvisoli]
MIVQCEQCQTRFKIPDEKVTEKGVKVRCTKCQNTFRVAREPTPALSAPPPAPSPGGQADPFQAFGDAPEPTGEVTRPGAAYYAPGAPGVKSLVHAWGDVEVDIDVDLPQATPGRAPATPGAGGPMTPFDPPVPLPGVASRRQAAPVPSPGRLEGLDAEDPFADFMFDAPSPAAPAAAPRPVAPAGAPRPAPPGAFAPPTARAAPPGAFAAGPPGASRPGPMAPVPTAPPGALGGAPGAFAGDASALSDFGDFADGASSLGAPGSYTGDASALSDFGDFADDTSSPSGAGAYSAGASSPSGAGPYLAGASAPSGAGPYSAGASSPPGPATMGRTSSHAGQGARPGGAGAPSGAGSPSSPTAPGGVRAGASVPPGVASSPRAPAPPVAAPAPKAPAPPRAAPPGAVAPAAAATRAPAPGAFAGGPTGPSRAGGAAVSPGPSAAVATDAAPDPLFDFSLDAPPAPDAASLRHAANAAAAPAPSGAAAVGPMTPAPSFESEDPFASIDMVAQAPNLSAAHDDPGASPEPMGDLFDFSGAGASGEEGLAASDTGRADLLGDVPSGADEPGGISLLGDVPAYDDGDPFKITTPRREVVDLANMRGGPAVTVNKPSARMEDVGMPQRRLPGRARKLTGFVVNLTVATALVVALGALGTVYLRDGRVDPTTLSPDRLRTLVLPPSRPFIASDVSNGLYETRDGRMLFIVRGEAENRTGAAAAVRVRAALFDGDQRVRSSEGLAGALATPEDLHAVTTREDATALRQRMDAAALPVPPGGKVPFLVVFQEFPADLSGFRLEVTLEPAPSEPTADRTGG